MAVRSLGLALAEWRKFAMQLAGIGAISILTVLGLTGVMWRQLEARKTAEEARANALNELTLANENLARSNRDLQEFAQVASHDLQEPLRKIRYFSEKLKGEYGTSLGEGGFDKLARLNSATERMQRLINDLLEFARVTTRAEPFKVMALDTVVAEVISDLEARIIETGAKITTARLPRIMADPTQMRQLFQNLIGNAIKYRRADIAPQVKILSESVPATPKSQCRIVVEDNGIGFEQKYANRIFQPFQRLHGRNAYDGTGMGLAICRKIVERHGGTLTAESRVDEGTRFVVTLPLRQKEEETQSCAPEANPSPYSLQTMIPTTAR
jgi:light-regulated signal transduction histidine kinase (bacteriophytochrome)